MRWKRGRQEVGEQTIKWEQHLSYIWHPLQVICTFSMALLLFPFSPPLSEFSTLEILSLIQRDSEILKANISGEHTSANIWRNKLGPKCFHEWELYYKIYLVKVKGSTGNWQGLRGLGFSCLFGGFGFDFFNGRKLYDWKKKQISSHILDYLPLWGFFV